MTKAKCRTLMIAAMLAAPLCAQTSASDFNFDQGIDVHALMQQDNGQAHGDSLLPPIKTATRSCAVAKFKPSDAATSAPMALQSLVTERVCHTYWGKTICGDQTLETVTRSVVLSIQGTHTLLPWETEAFSVCLQGDQTDVKTLSAAYKYGEPTFRAAAGQPYAVILPAVEKIATAPDPEGVTLQSFTETADGVALSFTDKWTQYYKGDETGLSVEVKRDMKLLPDPVVFEQRVSQAAAASYSLTFKDVQGKLRTGEKYYVVWKFSRQGKVSTGAEQPGGRSQELTLTGLHN